MKEIDRIRNQMADGLESMKRREYLSNKAIGTALGMSGQSISRIIAGGEVRLTIDQALQLILLAGMKIERGSK